MFWRELMIGTIRRNCARLSLVETLPKPPHLLQNKADRAHSLIKTGAISKDDFETAITAAGVGQAELERDEAAVDYANSMEPVRHQFAYQRHCLKKYRELGDTINFGGQIERRGSTDIAQFG